jgi:protein-tyrosine phosphatase
MIPLIDMHCHLLAGLDDGPATEEEALEMCRIAAGEGIRSSAATAHQNEQWKAVTPERIREASKQLAGRLRAASLPLAIWPCAEVMVNVDIERSWQRGELLSVADRGQYLLIEFPHGIFVELQSVALSLRHAGARPILAHAERQPELLHDPGRIEALIQAGCLVQVNAGSVTEPASRQDAQALKDWFRRGIVHLMGSDGHSPRRRRPQMAAAYRQIVRWVGTSVADRVCSINGAAVLHGLPLRIPEPEQRRTSWFARLW